MSWAEIGKALNTTIKDGANMIPLDNFLQFLKSKFFQGGYTASNTLIATLVSSQVRGGDSTTTIGTFTPLYDGTVRISASIKHSASGIYVGIKANNMQIMTGVSGTSYQSYQYDLTVSAGVPVVFTLINNQTDYDSYCNLLTVSGTAGTQELALDGTTGKVVFK